jgi:hypothetical protein
VTETGVTGGAGATVVVVAPGTEVGELAVVVAGAVVVTGTVVDPGAVVGGEVVGEVVVTGTVVVTPTVVVVVWQPRQSGHRVVVLRQSGLAPELAAQGPTARAPRAREPATRTGARKERVMTVCSSR